jgi:hypothetical protein
MTRIAALGLLAVAEDQGTLVLSRYEKAMSNGEHLDLTLPLHIALAELSGWLGAATHIGEVLVAIDRGMRAYRAGRITAPQVHVGIDRVLLDMSGWGLKAEAELKRIAEMN